MRISYNWLREWVPVPLEAAALAERLTQAGLEVDAVERIAPQFQGVVVGEVRAVAPHPRAGHLSLCRVDAGGGMLEVVCGAPGVTAGLRAAFAPPGAVLPGGRRIEAREVQGVRSAGMLCSALELGLGEEGETLLAAPAQAAPGTPLADALDLDDYVIEVDLTPNRGDCLSVLGVAREAAVLTGTALRASPVQPQPAHIDDALAVTLAAPAGCPVYAGRVIRGVDARAPSPAWLRERLRRAGVRAISAVVDVTNYVMLDLGQPLHAFDLATLRGGITVRYGRAGERLELLDGQQVDLDPQTLVIADAARPVALAGIMGGAPTGVGAGTTGVFLESAFFTPRAIAGRARALRLNTDASQRFERGVDFTLQVDAIERATELLLAIAGGRPGPVQVARAPEALPARVPVTLRRERLDRLLGFEVPGADVQRMLTGLGLAVQPGPGGWQAIPPPFRFDIAIEADLVEEVARLAGYQAMPARLPRIGLQRPRLRPAQADGARARAVLVERGYREVITYSFVDAATLALFEPAQEALMLANPISAEMAAMRTSLWPGLVRVLAHNLKRQRERVRVFELGSVFRPGRGGLEERPVLAGAVAGAVWPEQWGAPARLVDFFDLKGDVEALLERAGRPARFEPLALPALHPGQAARVRCDDGTAGTLGALHPALCQRLDLATPVLVFELPLAALARTGVPRYRAISRFPMVRRDLSVLVDRALPAAALLDSVRELAGGWLLDLQLFDVYQGERIDSEKKSIAIGLLFQDASSTLTDAQVDAVVERVREGLAGRHGAALRS